MRGIIGKIALVAIMTGLAAKPAEACWNSTEQDAIKITHLNTMLLVTALRCRGGRDNFLPDYNRFVSNNSSLIGAQSKVIKAHLVQTYGTQGAEGALDRMAIGFANSYGTGHQNMSCGQLKALVFDLASRPQGVSTLTVAADASVGETPLPGGVCPVRIATRP